MLTTQTVLPDGLNGGRGTPLVRSSSLDRSTLPLETTGGESGPHIKTRRYGSAEYDDLPPCLPEESQFRHGGWATARRRIYQALLNTGQSCRRIQNFCDCGSALWLNADGSELVLTCNRCHDRLCAPCQKERQAAVVEGVLLRCHDAEERLRFMTLTLKHSDTTLSLQIDRLITCFRLLRRHPSVATAMIGGAWFLEVKLDKNGVRWHPHLHVIVEGGYIDQKTLSKAWYESTGDSYIVDIRIVGNVADRARYVTKYATKPLHAEVVRVPAKLEEFVRAIKGRRLYQCFGSWSKAVHRTKGTRKLGTPLGSVNTIWLDALAGDEQAWHWLTLAHGRWPRLRTAYPLPPLTGSPAPPDDPASYV